MISIITGGGIRTHPGVPPQRILSPQRLPFRHAGNRKVIDERGSARHKHTEACVPEAMRARPESETSVVKRTIGSGRTDERRLRAFTENLIRTGTVGLKLIAVGQPVGFIAPEVVQ